MEKKMDNDMETGLVKASISVLLNNYQSHFEVF